MTFLKKAAGVQEAAEISTQLTGGGSGGRWATALSGAALLFSGFSLWDTSLKASDLRVFIAPVIQYASPYQNSNFEMFALPVTLTNEGARTGTVLSMELAVTDPRSNQTKRFYAADFGRWTMEKTRSGAYSPFSPMSLAGRTSRTETVLFYTRGDAEKPSELVRQTGPYQFTLTLELAEEGVMSKKTEPSVSFERDLKFYDARAFENGTLPLYSKDWRSSSNQDEKKPD